MPPVVFYLLTLAIFAAIYGTLAIGLNIQWGYSGILDFMYIAFVAVGGYVMSLLMLPPVQPGFGETYILGLNWPFIPALLVGGLASALLAFIIAIRHGPHSDAHPRGSVALAVLPLAVTWVGDTCALAAGSLFGGPQLAPVLSPRKTWAGALGGVVGALATTLIYGTLVLDRVALRLSVWQLMAVGLVAAVAAQVCDVSESLFKREAGVKDSSSLFPGHGGVLDRLDALYFVMPLTAGLLRLFGIA